MALTEHLRSIAERLLPPGSEVDALTAVDAPLVVETALEGVAAGTAVVALGSGAEHADAVFVACFGNHGVDELRSRTSRLVVGLGEASLAATSFSAGRFGLLTTLECGIDGLWAQVTASGRHDACVGIRAVNHATTGIPEPGSRDDSDDVFGRLRCAGSHLVDAGAAAIVLACATFSPHAGRLADSLSVTVFDGARLGPLVAHSLWASRRSLDDSNVSSGGAS